MRRRAVVIVLLAALLLGGSLWQGTAARPTGPEPGPRHDLAGGCFTLRAADGTGAGLGPLAPPLRFVATDLGRYLLVEPDGGVLAAGDRQLVRARTPSVAAEWDVRDASTGPAVTLRSAARGEGLTVAGDGSVHLGSSATPLRLRGAGGCVEWPEVATGVSGPHLRGGSPIDAVRGYADTHLHLTAFEFLGGRAHCGRPWHRYGVAHALVDCPDHQVADGTAAVLENLTGAGNPVGRHDPVGWPTFRDWPAPDSLTHEQTYHRWVERAWRGGVRMIVNLLVENRVLCEVYPLKQNPCDEMASVRRQAASIREMERYIDAQHGGPGQGWFRIVDDPTEARRVVNEGKLAVVLGIEISEPFGCRAVLDQPRCSAAEIDAQLDELAALGVRQVFLVHKFDNALGGVKGDGGTNGLVTNPGNVLATGHAIDMRTCGEDAHGRHDHTQDLPIYPPPPHCNVRGLTPLGAHAVEAVVERGLILDVDHMSGGARAATLDLLEQRGHSGVISSHGWADDASLPRILDLGGVVGPYAGDSTSFTEAWRELRPLAPDDYHFGVGFGADSNGLGTQGRARRGPNPVRYPFTGLGGTTIQRQVTGARTFDVNVDGVAHYGLYPDWIEDLRMLAGDEIVADLAEGAEAYLQMWERAAGARRAGNGCLLPGADSAIRSGMGPDEVVAVAGQPQRRTASTFEYCDGQVRFDDRLRAASVRLGASPSEAAVRALAAATWAAARTGASDA